MPNKIDPALEIQKASPDDIEIFASVLGRAAVSNAQRFLRVVMETNPSIPLPVVCQGGHYRRKNVPVNSLRMIWKNKERMTTCLLVFDENDVEFGSVENTTSEFMAENFTMKRLNKDWGETALPIVKGLYDVKVK